MFAIELSPMGWTFVSPDRYLDVSNPGFPVPCEKATVFADEESALSAVPDSPPWNSCRVAPFDGEDLESGRHGLGYRAIPVATPGALVSGHPHFCVLFRDGWLAGPHAPSPSRTSVANPEGLEWTVSDDHLCALRFHSPEAATLHVGRRMALPDGSLPDFSIVECASLFRSIFPVGRPAPSLLSETIRCACENLSIDEHAGTVSKAPSP